MNIQELIEAVIELPVDCSGPRPKIDKLTTLELIKLLGEPEKVKVPQFVADYIEFKKENDFHVYGAMRVIGNHYDKRVPEWFYDNNIETFARAWLDGYELEVEKEKWYLVKFKEVEKGFNFLNFDTLGKEWKIFDCNNSLTYRTRHTRKELEEAGFGWVFDCEGIEIEEVED